MKKITIVLFLSIFFSVAASAGTDGENLLTKNKALSLENYLNSKLIQKKSINFKDNYKGF